MKAKVILIHAILIIVISAVAVASGFAEEQCALSDGDKCESCLDGGACPDSAGDCEEGYLDEWWMIERYVDDELVDVMGIQAKIGECVYFETGPQGGEPTIQSYVLSYPLKEKTLKLDLNQSERWYKGEIPDYGAIYVKQVDPNEHWLFRFGEREVVSLKSFDPSKTHTYIVSKVVDGVEKWINETTVPEGGFYTLSFNEEPRVILATTGCEGTELTEELAKIDWFVFDCGDFGIVYVAPQKDVDTFVVDVDDIRFAAIE